MAGEQLEEYQTPEGMQDITTTLEGGVKQDDFISSKEKLLDNELKVLAERSSKLKRNDEILFMIDLKIICSKKKNDTFESDKNDLIQICQNLNNNTAIDKNYIEGKLKEWNDSDYKTFLIESLGFNKSKVTSHPNNDKLKNGTQLEKELFENNKNTLELEYGERVWSIMNADTGFGFLQEHRDKNDDLEGEKVQEFDISDIKRAREVFDQVLQVLEEYNNIFGGTLKIRNIYISSLQDGNSFAGMYAGDQIFHNQRIIINVSKYHTPYQIRRIIHHELTHCLDDDTDADQENWNKLGDINFDAHTPLFGGKEVYGSKNAHESKATLGEQLMTNPLQALYAARNDFSGSLKKKIEVMTGCKISSNGFYFESTFTDKTYPQEYRDLGFSSKSYYLGWSTGKMNSAWRNAKSGVGASEKINSYNQDDTHILYSTNSTNRLPVSIQIGKFSLSLKEILIVGDNNQEKTINARKLASYINEVYETYILPLKGGTTEINHFGLDKKNNIIFTNDNKNILKNKRILENRTKIGVIEEAKSANLLVSLLNSLYSDVNF